jgi:hypothetical protein
VNALANNIISLVSKHIMEIMENSVFSFTLRKDEHITILVYIILTPITLEENHNFFVHC